jgi:hypothetical protein
MDIPPQIPQTVIIRRDEHSFYKELRDSGGRGPDRNEPGSTLSAIMTTAVRLSFNRQNARKLLIILILIEIALVAIYLIHFSFELPRQLHKISVGVFQFHDEVSIPSWLVSMQFFTIGALFLLHRNWPKFQKLQNRWFLHIIGIGFMVLSLDSLSEISEAVLDLLGYKTETNRFFYESPELWIIPCTLVAIVLLTIGRSTLTSMLAAYGRETRIMLSAFVLYVICRIFLTTIDSLSLQGTAESNIRHLAFTFKIFAEMFAASVFLYATILCAIRDPNLPDQ